MHTRDLENSGNLIEDPLVGRTLNGRFRILEPLGVGGMGKVYRALQAPLDRVVALKVLNPNLQSSKDSGFQKRFLREAALTSRLRHPNTVTVIDYGQTDDGIYYIAMEYLEGRTLGQVLAEAGPLPWARALSVTQQICRSLREAHKQGVVHRDLKPANIMLLNEADHDLVKVLDFGLVKSFAPSGEPEVSPEVTQSGMFLGSPLYMAPEQARNQSDARSDVYSLGVLLYQMLVGRPPFTSADTLELIFAHHKEPPPAFSSVRPELAIPPWLEGIVRKCLEKDPAQRYQTMDELLEALRAAIQSAGVSPSSLTATTGPHPTPAFLHAAAAAAAPSAGGGNTIAVDISVEVPDPVVRARRRMLMMGGLVGGAVVALLAGVLLLARWHLLAPEPTAEPVTAAPAAPAAEQGPEVVRFRLMSEPPGAHVYYQGEDRGTTPLVLEVPRGAEGAATVELTFSLEGYGSETVITGGTGEVVFSQKLEPIAASKSPSKPAVARAERSSGTRDVAEEPVVTGAVSAPVMLEPESAPASPKSAGAAATSPPAASAPPPVGSLAVPLPVLAQAPVSPQKGAVLPFSEGMPRPQQVSGGDIIYTREALAARVEGTMVVRCIITQQGRVERCQTIKGLPYMTESVVRTLQSRTYKPIIYQGAPVAVEYTFSLRLALPRRSL